MVFFFIAHYLFSCIKNIFLQQVFSHCLQKCSLLINSKIDVGTCLQQRWLNLGPWSSMNPSSVLAREVIFFVSSSQNNLFVQKKKSPTALLKGLRSLFRISFIMDRQLKVEPNLNSQKNVPAFFFVFSLYPNVILLFKYFYIFILDLLYHINFTL